MSRVIVLYAPDTPDAKKAAERVGKAFAAASTDPSVKSAREGSIQDIAASDIVVIGIDGQGNGNHPDFREINRALSGINLAGRGAGIFLFDANGTEAIVQAVATVFRDSEIRFVNDPLVFRNGHADSKKTSEWVETIVSMHKEGHHG